MTLETVMQFIQTASIVLAIVVAFGTIKGRKSEEVADLTEMKVDIKYIKEKVAGMGELEQRIAKVEASAERALIRMEDLAHENR